MDASGNTWTYVSADGNTGVFNVNADVTAVYSVGMRVKYTQTSVKYGIITAIGAYAAGVTPVTIWGGTDYTLANAAVSANYYSMARYPVGFPASPAKWMVKVTDTTLGTQASPVNGTWYNINTNAITIPIGVWTVVYEVVVQAASAGGTLTISSTLSTANNSESDAENTTDAVSAVATSTGFGTCFFRVKVLSLAAKTAYYLNERVSNTATNLYMRGDLSTTVLIAVCAYL